MKEPVKPQENGEHPSWSYEDTPDNQRAISLAAEEVIGQHVPYKPSKRDLLKAHELNLDVLKEAPALREIKRIILPNAYPPSSIPLIDLERVCYKSRKWRDMLTIS